MNIRVRGEGRLSGLVLGLALGVVWVPCIGPFLSSILAMVGTSGQLLRGVLLLGFYALGLAIPMLAVAYSSHIIQRKLRAVAQQETLFRCVTGRRPRRLRPLFAPPRECSLLISRQQAG